MLLAERVASRLAMTYGPDPWQIARGMELPVFRRPLPPAAREVYFEFGNEPGDRGLVVSAEADPREARELVAHGLGHHCLHVGNRVTSPARRLWTGRYESEADVFAACLLIPTGQLRRALNRMDEPSTWELAEDFDVSFELVRRRLALLETKIETESLTRIG